MSAAGAIRLELREAIDACDADALEHAISAAFEAGLPSDLVDILAAALLMPWHRMHEDLVLALQTTRDPNSVTPLFAAANVQHDYLNYDEFFGLARKCTWALADIGTPEAKERLRDLSHSTNTTIAGYAQRRLDRWELELPRKGRRA